MPVGVGIDSILAYIDAEIIPKVEAEQGGITSVLTGGARGFDREVGMVWARSRDIEPETMKPQYMHSNDRGAPLRRNKEMVKVSDVLVALDIGSRGTAHTIDEMKRYGKPVYTITIEDIEYETI